MPARYTEFIGDVPEFRIADGCMHIQLTEESFLVMPLRTFRLALARSSRVVDEHDSAGQVVPLRRRKRG